MAAISTYRISGTPTIGTSEVQLLTIGGAPTAGGSSGFKLAYRGQVTSLILWNATNATLIANVQAALRALSTINGANVTVADVSLAVGVGGMSITFGGTLARVSVPAITVNSNEMTGTVPTVAVTVTTEGVDATQASAPKGSLLEDDVTGLIYRNAGTLTAPIWQLVNQQPTAVEAKTTSYAILTPDDNGKIFTNQGAGGAITFSLPAATLGQEYHFVLKAAQELRIDPNGSETISLPTGVQQAAGKYITANAIGERISVECVKAGEWDTKNGVGTWEAET